MERSAYTLLHAMESSWWYAGRRRAVLAALTKADARHARKQKGRKEVQGKVSRALDYGAGYGGMRDLFAALAQHTDACEPDGEARAVAATRGYDALYADEASAFSHSYDLIGLFDVLEHIEDDRAFLLRARAALTDTSPGRIVITVPAFMSLWSVHDVEHHHFRRYTKKKLSALLSQAGYTVEYVSYWNCLLSIPAAGIRITGKTGEGGLTPPRFVNAVLTILVSIEATILRFMALPFGLSLVAVAEKKTGPM